MTRSSKVLGLLVAFMVLLAAKTSRAAPSAADVETAKALYVSGKELRDAGDLVASYEKLKAAHALVPTPITALELARALALLARHLEARQILATIERMPVMPDESKKASASRGEAQELAAQLLQLLPSLVVELRAAKDAQPVVTVDGERVPTESLGVPRKLNPGKHVVVARVGEVERTEHVDLAERETRTVTLDLSSARRPAVDRTPHDAVPPSPSASTSPWVTVTLIVAATGAVVGTTTGIIAWSKSGSLHDSCVAERCPPPVHDDLSLVQTTSTISTIGFGVAALSGVAALTLWLVSPTKNASFSGGAAAW